MRWALDNAERLDKATRHVFEHKLGLGLGSTKPPAPGTTPFGFKPQPAAPTAEPHPGHPYNPSSRPTPAADPNLGQTHTVESEFRPGPTFRPQPPPPRFEPPPPSELANLRAVVKSWYRKMSQQFHPDLGGDATKQAVLNECYRTLTQELDRWESQRNNPADQSKPTPNRNSRPLW
jgi:hypothetical protein